MKETQTLVLVSTSPTRKRLMEKLELPFETMAPDVNEDQWKSTLPEPRALAVALARAKAESARARYPSAVLIGSDQVAALGSQIFGKPGTEEVAQQQLRQLSGKTHQLFTAVCILTPEETFEHTDVTSLTARTLTPEEIQTYVQNDKPFDCAGSYRFESEGLWLFDRVISEDPSAIEGLPLLAVGRFLRKLGFTISLRPEPMLAAKD